MRWRHRALAALVVAWWAGVPVRAAEGKTAGAATGQAAHGAPAATRPASSGKVEAAGSLSQPEAKSGETIRFWVTIENHSADAIHDVRLPRLDAPAFAVQQISWQNERGPQHCDLRTLGATAAAGGDLASCGVLAKDLRAEESLTVEGELKALEAHEHQSLTAIAEWKNAGDRVSQTAVSLGDSIIRSGWGNFWAGAYEAVKDFALPVVLALLAFGLRRWDKKREIKRQAEERHRTQLAETWNKMLSESHRLTTNFYLHIASGCGGMLEFDRLYREESEKGAQADAAKLEQYRKRQLFYLVYLERRYIHLLDSAGGFYFKSRMGEWLVNACLASFLGSYTELWKEEIFGNLTAMAKVIDLNETGDDFFKKLDGTGKKRTGAKKAMAVGWGYFQTWRGGPEYDGAIAHLRAMTTILSYEMNRPYEYWYGEREKLEVDPKVRKTLEGLLAAVQDAEERKKITLELAKYLKGE